MEGSLSKPSIQHPEFPLERLPQAALEDAITELAASIAAATWRWLRLIAELDRRQAWGDWGMQSTAHWLNWKCGIDLGAAREKVRVARALEALPQIGAAFAAGELSYSKVRAMTRVATRENEDYLLMIGRHGTAMHVERLVRSFRRVTRLEETAAANRACETRALQWRHDDDGMLVITARLPAEAGALVLNALEAAARDLEDRGAGTQADGEREDRVPLTITGRVSAETWTSAEAPAAARRADAFCHLAEQFLARGPVPARQADRYQVVVHVVAEALHADGQDDAESARCELAHGPALAAETARRIACDAARVEIEDGHDGDALSIGRRTRAVPPAIRRALESRDRGCRFPGCTQHRYVDAHHVRHWADGGETSLANLMLLCRYHHRLLHEGGFTLARRDDGKLLFLRPDGVVVPEVPVPVPATLVPDLQARLHAEGVHVSAATCVPRWGGERMDLAMAIDGLVQLRATTELRS